MSNETAECRREQEGNRMRALIGVDVLIALLDAALPHHAVARRWLEANMAHGWASCPLTPWAIGHFRSGGAAGGGA